jgi:hypothetical protein
VPRGLARSVAKDEPPRNVDKTFGGLGRRKDNSADMITISKPSRTFKHIEKVRQQTNSVPSAGRNTAVRPIDAIFKTSDGEAILFSDVRPKELPIVVGCFLGVLRDGCQVYTGPSADELIVVSDSGTKMLPVANVDVLFAGKAIWIDRADLKGEALALAQLTPDQVPQYFAPKSVIKAAFEQREYPGFNQLVKIQRTAFFAVGEDGEIELITKPGYHQLSLTFYWPDESSRDLALPVWTGATRFEKQKAAVAAYGRLWYLLKDFPMSDVDRAAVIAAALCILARSVIGPCPMFLVMGNRYGVGKSKTFELVSILATGDIVPAMQFSDTVEEFRKALLATVRQGPSLIGIENIIGTFGGAAIACLLTGNGAYQDRDLGVARNVTVQCSAVVMGSANNVTLTGDMLRRINPINLVTTEERPEDRQDFEEANLLGHVREFRKAYLTDLITIMGAYIDAGQPDMQISPWGSFEGYSLVRSAIKFASGLDPADTRPALEGSNTDSEWLSRFLRALAAMDPAGKGIVTRALLDPRGGEPKREMLAVLEEITPPSGKLSIDRLGKVLRKHTNQPAGGLMLRHMTVANQARWFAQKIVKP